MMKNPRHWTQPRKGHESFLFRSAVLDQDGSITAERRNNSDGAVEESRATETEMRGTLARFSSLRTLDDDYKGLDTSNTAPGPSTRALWRLYRAVNDLPLSVGDHEVPAQSTSPASPGKSMTPTVSQRNAGSHTIVAFVNSASGGRMGNSIYESLKSHLGPSHVFDLNSCHKGNMPENILIRYAYDPMVRILACGGDGTMGWIYSSLDKVWATVLGGSSSEHRVHLSKYKNHLPLAIMPLGTGNDLSRQFGWGGKFKPRMKHESMVTAVQTSTSSAFDRWSCVIMPVEVLTEDEKMSIPKTLLEIQHDASDIKGQDNSMRKSVNLLNSLLGDDDSSRSISFSQRKHQKKSTIPQPITQTFDGVFCNYLSLGLDAKVAYLFHKERELHPERFTSPLKNKLIYVEEVPYAIRSPKLRKIVSVMVNNEKGELVKLKVPKDCRMVILQNIQSYGGGFHLSSKGIPSDGLIEVIFVSNVVVGVTKVITPSLSLHVAAQTNNVCIRTRTPMHCQVDGEPWLQGEGVIQVKFHSRNSILTKLNDKSSCSCMGGTEGTVVN